MPLYDYRCDNCNRTEEVFIALRNLEVAVPCSHCNATMKRLMSAPRIQMDYAGYSCPVTGKWVEGRVAHRANLAQHGCRLLEPGEREGVARRRQEEEAELDRKIGETVGRTIAGWSPEKQSKLAEELGRGASVDVVRQTPQEV